MHPRSAEPGPGSGEGPPRPGLRAPLSAPTGSLSNLFLDRRGFRGCRRPRARTVASPHEGHRRDSPRACPRVVRRPPRLLGRRAGLRRRPGGPCSRRCVHRHAPRRRAGFAPRDRIRRPAKPAESHFRGEGAFGREPGDGGLDHSRLSRAAPRRAVDSPDRRRPGFVSPRERVRRRFSRERRASSTSPPWFR